MSISLETHSAAGDLRPALKTVRSGTLDPQSVSSNASTQSNFEPTITA